MTTSPIPSATNEELLRKVIEAHVMGGCKKFARTKVWEKDFVKVEFELYGDKIAVTGEYDDGYSFTIWHEIIAILLDTEGCKAAYGEWSIGLYGNITGRWDAASRAILRSWHSGKGNNTRAALETAVAFLPSL